MIDGRGSNITQPLFACESARAWIQLEQDMSTKRRKIAEGGDQMASEGRPVEIPFH